MEEDQSFFVSFSYFLHFCLDLLHSMLCIKIYWHMFHAVQLILPIDIIREFVMSLQVIIYAKQNGAQMDTFAATGTRADIDDLRKTMAALGTRLYGSWFFVPRLPIQVLKCQCERCHLAPKKTWLCALIQFCLNHRLCAGTEAWNTGSLTVASQA